MLYFDSDGREVKVDGRCPRCGEFTLVEDLLAEPGRKRPILWCQACEQVAAVGRMQRPVKAGGK